MIVEYGKGMAYWFIPVHGVSVDGDSSRPVFYADTRRGIAKEYVRDKMGRHFTERDENGDRHIASRTLHGKVRISWSLRPALWRLRFWLHVRFWRVRRWLCARGQYRA